MALSLNALVEAIQKAILTANSTLVEHDLNLIDQFFEPPERSKGEDASEEDGGEHAALHHVFSSGDGQPLKPRMIPIEMPSPTEDGVEMTTVQVPLITLIKPICPEVAKVRFTTDLNVSVSPEGDLEVQFVGQGAEDQQPYANVHDAEEGKKNASTRLEIELSPGLQAKGLKALVESYEKVLKSQMPGGG